MLIFWGQYNKIQQNALIYYWRFELLRCFKNGGNVIVDLIHVYTIFLMSCIGYPIIFKLTASCSVYSGTKINLMFFYVLYVTQIYPLQINKTPVSLGNFSKKEVCPAEFFVFLHISLVTLCKI